MLEPLPCFVCDELPKVGSCTDMTLRRRWTCRCPYGHYETAAYRERDSAVREWNAWVESDEFEEWEDEDDE